jgi:ABC-2 type transport system permease protein
MNFQRISAVTRKEFIHVLRDPRSLIMGLALPMLLLFMFGYALTLDVDRVPIIIWDQDNSNSSREFISRYSGSSYFTLFRITDNYHDIEHAIDDHSAILALIIPHDFETKIHTGRNAAIQVIIDGSDSNTATIALSYAEFVTNSFSENLALKSISRYNALNPSPSLLLQPRIWFNSDMLSRNAIVPGLIAVIMMVIAALLTSLTVAREWETGSMEQLISTPLKGSELVLGKLVPYFCIGVFDLALSLLVGRYVFEVPFRGNLILLLLLAMLFLILALSIGMLISIIVKNQFVSSQIAMVATLLPAFLLSGFIFPIENMPKAMQIMTHVIPARYFVTILRGIYLKGVGLTVLWKEALFLGLFASIIISVAIMKFNRKIT